MSVYRTIGPLVLVSEPDCLFGFFLLRISEWEFLSDCAIS